MTEVAKFLRKLRIDNVKENGDGENLGDMAEKLGISAAYLSSIENGKRPVQEDLKERLFSKYDLTEEQKEEFARIVAGARKKVEVDLSAIHGKENFPEYVDTAVMFANDLSKMTDGQLAKVKKLLQGFKKSAEGK